MNRIVKHLARRGAVMVLMSVSLAAVAGGSYVVATQLDPPVTEVEQPEPTPETEDVAEKTEAPKDEDAPKAERFHGDEEHPCEMPEGVELEVDWNHGNYVSAWAKAGDKEAHKVVAKSLCGEPQSAVDARLRKEAREAARAEKPKGHGKVKDHKVKPDRGSDEGVDGSEY